MKKKLLIFDFDGTLFANSQSHTKILARLMNEKYGINVEEFIKIYGEVDKEIKNIKEFSSSEEFYRQFNTKLLDKLNLDSAENGLNEFNGILKNMRMIVKKEATIYPNVLEVLDLLKKRGFKLAILSGAWNQEKIKEVSKEKIEQRINRINEILKNTTLHQFFDEIFIGWNMGLFKPDKKAFEKVLNHFEVLPEEAVMIGDEEFDVLASEVGITTILFNPENKYAGKTNPDYTFKEYSSLPKIIDSL